MKKDQQNPNKQLHQTPVIGSSGIMGHYGCPCHCYNSIAELKFFERQKLFRGQIVKRRHCGSYGFVMGIFPETKFYQIEVLPCKYASDQQLEHVSCLIPESHFSELEKQELAKLLKIVSKSKVAGYRQTSLLDCH